MRIYGGVDPGKKGYFSFLYDEDMEDAEKIPMPLDENGDVCGYGVADIIRAIQTKPYELFLYTEKLTGRIGWAANANYNFGKGVGELVGPLKTLGVNFVDIQPKVWQKEIWEACDIVKVPTKNPKRFKTDTKETSYNAAKRLFPHAVLDEVKEKKYYKDTSQNRKLGRVGKEIESKEKKKPYHDGLVDSLLIAEYCRRIKRNS